MVDSEQIKIPSLAEQWSLQEEQQPVESEPSVETTNQDEQSADSTDGAVLEEKIDETPIAEESIDETPTVDESTAADGSDESTEEAADAAEEVEEDAEEQPEIKIETAPADFRFPTTNQTRHCFTRYIEYHRCIAAKGDEAPECDKFAKYYRSLCPGEWIERWNEQRENGTFPGPL